MKRICCLFLFLFSSCLWGISVQISVNTSSLEIQNGEIVNCDTLNSVLVNSPILIESTKNKLYYKHNGQIISGNSLLIMPKDEEIDFKSNHNLYRYKGNLKLFSQNGRIKIINSVDLEDYVEGVLKAEFVQKAPFESIKAQAICIRTFVLKKTKEKNYHLCDTTHCQVYKGVNEVEIYKRAVKETLGFVLRYNGELITTMFSPNCGGNTASWNESHNTDKFPYLTSVKDVEHKKYTWDYKISLKELSKKTNLPNVENIIIVERYKDLRIKKIVFENSNNKKSFTGEELRKTIGYSNIKSAIFDFEIKEGFVLFKGKGYGHGFGMCQYGAMEMGKKGFSCRDILKHYYKGSEITR